MKFIHLLKFKPGKVEERSSNRNQNYTFAIFALVHIRYGSSLFVTTGYDYSRLVVHRTSFQNQLLVIII